MTEDEANNVTAKRKGATWIKVAVFGAVALAVAAAYYQFGDRLTLDSLAEQETSLRQYQTEHPLLVFVVAFLVYVTITGLSLPGAVALTLVYGWYFGFLPAVILVSFASTAGATTAFLLSRYLFRDAIQKRFGDQLTKFNEALEREGAFYLFTLRLIPAIPFFVINVVMGLTRIGTTTFWWVSQVGMFAGTLVFVYAGASIPSLSHLADVSQLRSTDILDWDNLIQAVRTDAQSSGPATRIRELLSDETRGIIDGVQGQPDLEARTQILSGLNQLVIRPDLVLDEPWRQVFETAGGDEQERRAMAKRLSKTNRDILVAAFPGIVSPPRPILSKQLILAFVVLGVFPLVVRKIMQRFRKTPMA
jgi:uncharacterized membrane protein YdjX (TVP38/TMEM64 family)